MSVYKIRPLVWRFEDGVWKAECIGVKYFIEPRPGGIWTVWDDDGNGWSKASLEEGRAFAESRIQACILPALEEVPGESTDDFPQTSESAQNPSPANRAMLEALKAAKQLAEFASACGLDNDGELRINGRQANCWDLRDQFKAAIALAERGRE